MKEIFERTSVRSYAQKEVEEDKIQELLRSAMASPTALNQQAREYVVVTDKPTLAKLSKVSPGAIHLENAQLCIAVCFNNDLAISVDYFQQDCSASTENILLSATSLGLGGVWMGIAPNKERMERVSQVLELPSNVLPFNLISLGYPKDKPTPKQKFNPKSIHYQKY
ncbi:MAG: nitroreductase family protein [Clostridia bacterium]